MAERDPELELGAISSEMLSSGHDAAITLMDLYLRSSVYETHQATQYYRWMRRAQEAPLVAQDLLAAGGW